MSKVLCVAVVLLAVGFPLLAQQGSQATPAPAVSGQTTTDQQQPTPDQKKELEQKELFVDQGAVVLNAGNISPVSNSHVWDGRQGFKIISESDFYQIAGLPKVAEEASSYRSTSRLLIYGGVFGDLGAAALSIVAASTNISSSDPNYNRDVTTVNVEITVAAALVAVALIPEIIGIHRLHQNWSSAQEALQAADDYNAKLVKVIPDQNQSQ
jgi:hypothetical protein